MEIGVHCGATEGTCVWGFEFVAHSVMAIDAVAAEDVSAVSAQRA